MGTELTVAQRAVLATWLASSAVGVGIWQANRMASSSIGEWPSQTVITFSYFTNSTNALVIVLAAALLVGRGRLARWAASPSVQAATSLYIVFVGLAFWFLLGGPEPIDRWWLWIPEATAHTLSPALGFLYWVWLVPTGSLRLRHPFVWLAYPIGYLAYWLVRGPIVGEYPYFFVDVDELGYGGVAIWSGVLVAAFVLLGSTMVGVDRSRARRATAARLGV